MKTPPKVKIDRKKEPGEFDTHFQAGSLGLSIDHLHGSDHVHVIALSKDGQAAKFKRIRVHDIVVMIGDEVVLGKSTKDVKAVIQKHERPVRIRFRHEDGKDDEEVEEEATKKATSDVDKDAVSTFDFLKR